MSSVSSLTVLGDGRMGRAIETLASERGLAVQGVFGREALGTASDRVRSALEASDVAIDVSVPTSAVDNIMLCLDAGRPVVVGTTR